MKVLWRSDVLLNSIGTEVRLINMAGDVIFEFALPVRMTFRERVRNIVRYLLGKKEIVGSMCLTNEEFKAMCKEVTVNGGEDSKN